MTIKQVEEWANEPDENPNDDPSSGDATMERNACRAYVRNLLAEDAGSDRCSVCGLEDHAANCPNRTSPQLISDLPPLPRSPKEHGMVGDPDCTMPEYAVYTEEQLHAYALEYGALCRATGNITEARRLFAEYERTADVGDGMEMMLAYESLREYLTGGKS